MASCCICFSAFKSNDLLATTECGHVFHEACIHAWLSSNWNTQTCPTCRHFVTRQLLRRLHLNFEETTQNTSIVRELQNVNISMKQKLKKMEHDLASIMKKNNTLSKSKDTYQHRAAQLKEDVHKLNETKKNLKIELRQERKQRNFYENECLALSAQISEMEIDW